MSKYITVANSPNKIATVHLNTCSHLGPDPVAQTASASRSSFEDGLDAIAAAQDAMPENFGFCGHCLSKFRRLLAH